MSRRVNEAIQKMREAQENADKAEASYFSRQRQIRDEQKSACRNRGHQYYEGMTYTRESEDMSLQRAAADYRWYMEKVRAYAMVVLVERGVVQ